MVIEPHFNSERLRLARAFRGMTLEELAGKSIVSKGLVWQLERELKGQPTPDLVAAFGEVLGFSPGFFYEPVLDPWLERECSFRHRRSTPDAVKRRARAHGTLVGMIVSQLGAVLRFPKYNVPYLPSSGLVEIEEAAEKCRQHWHLGIDTPITEMSRVLENAGVILVKHLAHSEKIDAFSRRGNVSVVVLNTARESTSRWIWDLAHELGHLVLHKDSHGDLEAEKEADLFAASFLLPRRAFSREFGEFSWDHVFQLKRRWKTSAAAIVYRAWDLRLIDAVTYRRAFKQRSAKGWTRSEPGEPIFIGPELLPRAFESLEKGVGETAYSLSTKLHINPATFTELTGVPVSETWRPRLVPFKGRAPAN